MQIVKTFDTIDNTYFVSYGKIAKTSYEQQLEHKEEIKCIQRKVLMIIGLISVCIVLSLISAELIIPFILVGLFGIAAILTDNICI